METNDQIRKIGESAVAQWLSGRGYTTQGESKAPAEPGIEVKGPVKNLIIWVTPVLQSEASFSPSYEDLRNIKVRAFKNDCDSYEALVPLNQKLEMAGQIRFKRL
jgi:hypothetical protein